MRFFILDTESDMEKMGFLNAQSNEYKLLLPQKHINSMLELVNYSNEIVKNSSSDDVLIFWYDFIGIVAALICRLKKKKRKIIIINLLVKKKNSIKNNVARLLYRIALNDTNVTATVTSTLYGNYVNEILGTQYKFKLLRDVCCMKDSTTVSAADNNYIFCGGRNGRDWNFIIKIAAMLPEYDFHLVMPKDVYQQNESVFSGNIKARYDLSEQEFTDELAMSSFVAMPLDTEAPAGLLSFYEAAGLHKAIITTDTVTTREYFCDNRGVLCSNDLNLWCETIRYYMVHKEKLNLFADYFLGFLKKNCSPFIYAETLDKIITGEL